MKNISLLLALSTLLAVAPATQAAEHHGRHINYGDGINMTQYNDNSGFEMTVKNGPTFEFDSQSQSFTVKGIDGSTKVVKLSK